MTKDQERRERLRQLDKEILEKRRRESGENWNQFVEEFHASGGRLVKTENGFALTSEKNYDSQ